jgi:hypothetical protein
MTTTSIHAIGFCAHYSRQGDWAFGLALRLARAQGLQLNVFHFLKDPYQKKEVDVEPPSRSERERLVIEQEKELRLYYDEKLGDYLAAGFRLCEDNGWKELHHCLCKREFQVLVLAFPSYDAEFAGRPLVDFAYAFTCPVVLVGPRRSDELYLNRPAALLADRMSLGDVRWTHLEGGGKIPCAPSAGVAPMLHGS